MRIESTADSMAAAERGRGDSVSARARLLLMSLFMLCVLTALKYDAVLPGLNPLAHLASERVSGNDWTRRRDIIDRTGNPPPPPPPRAQLSWCRANAPFHGSWQQHLGNKTLAPPYDLSTVDPWMSQCDNLGVTALRGTDRQRNALSSAYEWRPSKRCRILAFTPRAFCEVLGAYDLRFVGDSITREFVYGLYKQMGGVGHIPVATLRAGASASWPVCASAHPVRLSPSRFAAAPSAADEIRSTRQFGACAVAGTVNAAAAATAAATAASPVSRAYYMPYYTPGFFFKNVARHTSSAKAHKPTVYVLSDGLSTYLPGKTRTLPLGSPAADALLERFRQYADTTATEVVRARLAVNDTVVYYTAQPGFEHVRDRKGDCCYLNEPRNNMLTVPTNATSGKYNWDLIVHFNRIMLRALARVYDPYGRLIVLDVASAGMMRPDLRIHECAHFHLPGMPDFWARMLLHKLAEGDCNRRRRRGVGQAAAAVAYDTCMGRFDYTDGSSRCGGN
jgi:hypothetical protein